MNINEYIDYKRMFDDIVKDTDWNNFYEDEVNYDQIKLIKKFAENNYNGMNIQQNECDIYANIITFVFGIGYNDANESDPEGGWCCVYITYRIDRESFYSYEVEQG